MNRKRMRVMLMLGWILAAALILLPMRQAPAEGYRTLQLGDTGDDVMALKTRMYELGYFSSTKFAPVFNETTKERLQELQKKNGLTADGVATPEVQALIFSDACLPKSAAAAQPTAPAKPKATAKPKTTAKPAASATPGIASPEDVMQPPAGAPALDKDGYLPAGQKPYSHADRSAGVWSYISQDIHIEIRQYSGKSNFGANLWLEASIRLRDPARLTSMLSAGKKPGTAMVQPHAIMSANGDPVFAINDDFFGYRVRYGGKVGVIVRDGKALYDDPKNSSSTVFPPLDILAVFQDGSMKTFVSDAHTAQEYIAMGVRDTYAFGPILVQDGKLVQDAAQWGTKRAPRLALGVTADGTVKVLDVLGRRTDAKGVSIAWVAEKMYEMGCVEALNLDGGNTTCLIFLGDMINRPAKTASKDIRYITGLIGIKEEPQ